ncbi:oligosaccharide flippase family protein [Psychrobacter faecalis]|uniref:oligosaccharide flippase family protein n=1 Tax=Psychrobacter faecalis TaxID=180588 RepID=UPI003FD10285
MSKSKQAFWVLLGSLSTFAFSIISSMILSRYFLKEDYGTYKQILYVYNGLLIVFTLGLPKTYSFFIPRLPLEEVKNAIKKINNILIISGICMSSIIFFGAEFIAELLNNNKLATPLRYFSLVPLFLLPTIGLEGILASFKKTQILAFYNLLTKSIMLLFVTLPVVFYNGGVNSAIVGFTIASFLAFILARYLQYIPIKNTKNVNTKLTYKEIFEYSVPLLYASFWGILIVSSEQFFVSRYFGVEIFAEFSNGSLQLPFVGMIVSATSIVLAPIYSSKAFTENENTKKEILEIWDSALSKTVKLTYPLIIFFWFFSDAVMITLYGESYIDSGKYFQVKLLADFILLITYGPLILSIGGNRFYYRVHMFIAIFLILSQYLSIIFINSPIAIVWISVSFQIIKTLIFLLFIARYFNVKLYRLLPWLDIAKTLPSFVILYSINFFIPVQELNHNPIFTLVIAGLIYLLIFSLWAYLCKLNYYSIIKPLLSKVL